MPVSPNQLLLPPNPLSHWLCWLLASGNRIICIHFPTYSLLPWCRSLKDKGAGCVRKKWGKWVSKQIATAYIKYIYSVLLKTQPRQWWSALLTLLQPLNCTRKGRGLRKQPCSQLLPCGPFKTECVLHARSSQHDQHFLFWLQGLCRKDLGNWLLFFQQQIRFSHLWSAAWGNNLHWPHGWVGPVEVCWLD